MTSSHLLPGVKNSPGERLGGPFGVGRTTERTHQYTPRKERDFVGQGSSGQWRVRRNTFALWRSRTGRGSREYL